MGTIGDSSGNIPLDPQAFYKEKLDKSIHLFEKSLDGYQNAEFAAKRDQYKKVMKEALLVMNEAAKAILNSKTKNEAAHLKQDYEELIAKKDSTEKVSEEDVHQLTRELKRLKNSF